ncbi:cyclin-F [Erpetoichthys calabaricus]|uniref:Cyclin-F n=1 Tax=Erpetoichthys calabaricus TaxID=27687 RepID=A0A8C4XA62_ERPCA|nr:cyclin-F [Erpetoichthys calabaricus]
MKVGVHCRCSSCYPAPTKRRVKKRIPVKTLLTLPEDVLLYILQCLSAEDLPSVRLVHSHLRDLIDSHTSVWARARFQDVWPSPENIWIFERAAHSGNFGAAVKLGIAYLYNEGPSVSDEGRAEVCGEKASHYFSLAESLRIPPEPFTWLFIRPPWSPTGSCCKAVVFESMKQESMAWPSMKGTLLHCLARVLLLFDDEDKHNKALAMLEESSKHGCLQSSFLLWDSTCKIAISDPGRYLQSLRTLRDYATKGCWEAQLALARACVSRNQLGLEQKGCSDLVSQIFQSSSLNKPSKLNGVNNFMRYILVDWLVEVATMKDFSSLTLHITVSCVDRYLLVSCVDKTRLQLLGIACMVICTRYTSKEILTIREAVWLTDNTYKYEDLVRMMGEVISVLEGKIRMPTILDYGEVLLSLCSLEKRSENLFKYICELSLLHTNFSLFSPALLASAAFLLTRILHGYALPWSFQLSEFTGFSLQDLTISVLSLHKKCFHDEVPKDNRSMSLTGVQQRFEDDSYQQISKEKVMVFSELCAILEVEEDILCKSEPPLANTKSAGDIHAFLTSPSSKNKRRKEEHIPEDRDNLLVTPTAELSAQEETLLGDFLDWSLSCSSSGYEGDQESETEEGDITIPVGVLDLEATCSNDHVCCSVSSEDESYLPELGVNNNVGATGCKGIFRTRKSSLQKTRESLGDFSSGYSSVNATSPIGLSEVSGTLRGNSNSTVSVLAQVLSKKSHRQDVRRQIKRKNGAEHSGEEMGISF